jgi:hypothetical protein
VEYEIDADESVSTAVVRAVGAAEGRDPRSLAGDAPLADVLDPAALDALFEPRSDGTPRIGGRLSFVYSNCRVTVENGEFLALEPLDVVRSEGGAGRRADATDPTDAGGPASDRFR